MIPIFVTVILSSVVIVSCSYQTTLNKDYYYLFTGSHIDLDEHVVHLEGLHSFTFEVRACSDVHIFLRDYIGANTEIILGADGNSISSIRKGHSPEDYVSVFTADILHCSELRAFWVSWNSTYIKVGVGPTPYYNVWLETERPKEDRHTVASASLATGEAHTGTWRLDTDICKHITVKTPKDVSFSKFWQTVENVPHFMTFNVKSGDDVVVALGPEIGDAYYKVTFGIGSGNTSVHVRNKLISQTRFDLSMLSDYGGARLWIDWHDGGINIGHGLFAGRNSILKLSKYEIDTDSGSPRQIGAVGYASIADAYWDFIDDELMYVFHTDLSNGGSEYNNWLTTPYMQGCSFYVESCDQIKIAIAKCEKCRDDPSKRLDLTFSNKNGATYITVVHNNKTIHNKTLENELLHCNATRIFWMQWGRNLTINAVRQGSMNLLNIPVDITHGVPNFREYRAVGFGKAASEANWAVFPSFGDTGIVTTFSEEDKYQASIPIGIFDETRVFSLKTSSEATVYLTEGPERRTYEDKEQFHLILGNGGRKNAAIKYYTPAGDSKSATCTHNKDLISEDGLTYWVSWSGDVFFFGLGEELFTGVVKCVAADFTDKVPVGIKVGGITINSKVQAEWTFAADRGDELVIKPHDLNQVAEINLHESRLHVPIMFRYQGLKTLEWHFTKNYGVDDTNTDICKVYFDDLAIRISNTVHMEEKYVENITLSKGVFQADAPVPFWMIRSADGMSMDVGSGYLYTAKLGTFSIKSCKDFKDLKVTVVKGTEFRMSDILGTEVKLNTGHTSMIPNDRPVIWKETRLQRSIVFGIGMCDVSSALISLSSTLSWNMELDGIPEYKITMVSGDKSTIRISKGDKLVMELPSPNILRFGCDVKDEQFLWLAWGNDGEITIGYNVTLYENILANWYDLDPYRIHALGFTNSGEDNPKSRVQWRLHMGAGTHFEDLDTDGKDTTDGDNGLSGGAVAAIVIAVLFIIAIVAAIIYFRITGLPDDCILQSCNFGRPSTQTVLKNEMESQDNMGYPDISMAPPPFDASHDEDNTVDS